MPAIDYFDLENEIKAVLDADADLLALDVTVFVERQMTFRQGPEIGIYLAGREAVEERQNIAAGTEARFVLEFAIWCWEFGLEVPAAYKKLYTLLGLVEVALMRNRSLNGKVASGWPGGGIVDNALDTEGGFVVGSVIEWFADATASTTG